MKAATRGVSAKIFVGLFVTPEIRELLNHSKEWSDYSLVGKTPNGLNWHLVSYQNKEYFGVHIETSISIKELKRILLLCLDRYKLYFPDMSIDQSKLDIFSQIFIS